jgi:hypothetical protein
VWKEKRREKRGECDGTVYMLDDDDVEREVPSASATSSIGLFLNMWRSG